MRKRTLALALAVWTASTAGVIAAPRKARKPEAALTRSEFATSTFRFGTSYEIGRQLALVAGWDAEYGPTWLPYTGTLTTGVQLGL